MPRVSQYLDLSLVLLFTAGLLHGIVSFGAAAGDAWAAPGPAASLETPHEPPAWSLPLSQVATMFFIVGYPLALLIAASASWARRYAFMSLVCLLLATGRTDMLLGPGLQDTVLGAFNGVLLALLEVASLAFLAAGLGSQVGVVLASLAAPFHAAQYFAPEGTGLFAGLGFLFVSAAFAAAIWARMQGAGRTAPMAAVSRFS